MHRLSKLLYNVRNRCSTMKLNCFGRNSERSMYELTGEEMQAVRDVWKKAKEREIGKHILRALIERKPQFKDYFGIHGDENKDDVYNCREFMLQSHRIQNFLDTAVSSLGFCPIGNIHQMAYRIGQIHFYRGVNFGADNWLTFKKVTVEIVTHDGSSSESSSMDLKSLPSLFPSNSKTVVIIGWEKFMSSASLMRLAAIATTKRHAFDNQKKRWKRWKRKKAEIPGSQNEIEKKHRSLPNGIRLDKLRVSASVMCAQSLFSRKKEMKKTKKKKNLSV